MLAIVELRRRRLTQARISAGLGLSEVTISRVLRRVELSRFNSLQPVEPAQHYVHAAPGDLQHIDTKKVGQIERLGDRITGNPRDHVRWFG